MKRKLKIIRSLAKLDPRRALHLAEAMKCNKRGLDYRRRPLLEPALKRNAFLLCHYVLDTVGFRIEELEHIVYMDSLARAYYQQHFKLGRYGRINDLVQAVYERDMEMIRCA